MNISEHIYAVAGKSILASGVVGVLASIFDYFNVQSIANAFSVAGVIVGGLAVLYHRFMRARRKEHAESMKAEHNSELMLLEHNRELLGVILKLQEEMIAKAAGKTTTKDSTPCQGSEESPNKS